MSTLLPVTLSSAAAAGILGVWLMLRIGQVRMKEKISIGDGGNDLLTRRMRAQANFVENAPFVLALIAAIELSGKGDPWLAWVAGIFFIGRIAHAFGMDSGDGPPTRTIGIITTMLTLIGLSLVAALIAAGVL